jgi:hypothetical protein
MPEFIAGGTDSFNVISNADVLNWDIPELDWAMSWLYYPGNQTKATISAYELRYICDKGWMATLIISSGVLFLMAMGGIISVFSI